jgi:16S rRNA G527 N7-methylase RsmG
LSLQEHFQADSHARARPWPARFEELWSYVELLIKWNRRINLTASRSNEDAAAALERLVLEPLAAARIAKSRGGFWMSGRGRLTSHSILPGSGSASELVLIESRAKKAVFLREALRVTGIPDGRGRPIRTGNGVRALRHVT